MVKGIDIVYINGVSGVLIVNGDEGDDMFDVCVMGFGSEVYFNG